jgi:thiol-disulfide isomerase/thioredoxin
MELEYIGANWCKSCKIVKPRAKTLAEKANFTFVEFDYDILSEKEQEPILKIPAIRIKINGTVVKEFLEGTAVDKLELYLQSEKLLPEEDF